MANNDDNGQGFLFEPRKLARTHDPVTSKIAAETSDEFLTRHHRQIHDALSAMVDGTPYEIADAAGMEPAAVFRRLNELQKRNRIELTGALRTGPHNRLCRVWKAL